MPDSTSPETEAQTPSKGSVRQHQHGDTTPTVSSPASPSISLYSLGISPFSPLRRQFSASFARSSESPRSEGAEHSDHQGLAEDSKDVLIQRLNDLAARLSAEDEVLEGSVDSMHAKVDEIEKVLSRSSGTRSRRHRRNQSSLEFGGEGSQLMSGPSTPTWLSSHLPEMSLPIPEPLVPPPALEVIETIELQQEDSLGIMPQGAEEVLVEAEALQNALEAVINRLKTRQEEQEHIHDLLITRVERAAQRIIYLEGRVKELEKERNEGEMDILNLQIQLKAIEVQCLSYVPKDADPELLDSIETWKAEWSALKRKRRKKGEELGASESPTPRGSRYSVVRSQTSG
ncbi:hypothetical protein BJ170DRAFT_51772 [Xylariales sp. AK1849]|nr:hypothetical protein BJ170DRAFT_51772 [Xylariales sp. AK1849]